jgi:hypothetical protein
VREEEEHACGAEELAHDVMKSVGQRGLRVIGLHQEIPPPRQKVGIWMEREKSFQSPLDAVPDRDAVEGPSRRRLGRRERDLRVRIVDTYDVGGRNILPHVVLGGDPKYG